MHRYMFDLFDVFWGYACMINIIFDVSHQMRTVGQVIYIVESIRRGKGMSCVFDPVARYNSRQNKLVPCFKRVSVKV